MSETNEHSNQPAPAGQAPSRWSSTGPYADQSIDAAFLHTKFGFFFVGPFSRRVSFASQQCRAIDLINALHVKNKLKDHVGPCEVAVIGGGIAGLTAAAILRGHGCLVHVFESAGKVLHLQEASYHRVIHPTIARWPGTRPLQYSTKFGVLDWCAGSSDSVLTSMREEWNWHRGYIQEGRGDPNHLAFTNAEVHELLGSSRNSPLVSIRTNAGNGNAAREANHKTYDLAVVATGFGRESVPPGLESISCSYWAQDQVDEWRASDKRVYVSGCGDGGLIDCLRLVHNDFQNGWLTIRLAQLMEATISSEKLNSIEEAESEALLVTKSIECMGMANRNIKEQAASELDQVYEKLGDHYHEFVRALPSAVADVLNGSIKRAGVPVNKVILCAQEAAPFTPRSAPIHKIMLAHAMHGNFIRFERATLSGQRVPARTKGARSKSVPVFTVSKFSPLRPEGNPVIIRHGPGQPFKDLKIEREEVESLRLRQTMLADFLDVERAQPNPWPKQWRQLHERGRDYYALKRSAVNALMQVICPGCEVGFDSSGFTYDQLPDKAKLSEGDLPPLDRPTQLFDIPVTERTQIGVIDAL